MSVTPIPLFCGSTVQEAIDYILFLNLTPSFNEKELDALFPGMTKRSHEATVKASVIPAIVLNDDKSAKEWFKAVDALLETVGLASLHKMNKYGASMTPGNRMDKMRTAILQGVSVPEMHPVFTKTLWAARIGVTSQLIPEDAGDYVLNQMYYAMLISFPNLETTLVQHLLKTIDETMKDSIPDTTSTPDCLKILYGTVYRSFNRHDLEAVLNREDEIKSSPEFKLQPGMDPHTLSRKLKGEALLVNQSAHKVVIDRTRLIWLLYRAVKESADHKAYAVTLRTFREMRTYGPDSYSDFTRTLHNDWLREVRPALQKDKANASKSETPRSVPWGYCFELFKEGKCQRGPECPYIHTDPGVHENKRNGDRRRDDNRGKNQSKKKISRALSSVIHALKELECESDSETVYSSNSSQTSDSEAPSGTETANAAQRRKPGQGRPKFKPPKKKKGKQKNYNVGPQETKKTDKQKQQPSTKQQPSSFQDTMKRLKKKFTNKEMAKVAEVLEYLHSRDEEEEPRNDHDGGSTSQDLE